MIRLTSYDFNKYLKEILSFSNDDETYDEFLLKYNELEKIVNSKIGPSTMSLIFENETYLNMLKYVLDLYDKAPINFKYMDIIKYIKDLLRIYHINFSGNSIINDFNDVFNLYKTLKNESISSLRLNSEVPLNVFMESLRLVLLSYKKDLEKVHDLSWYAKTRLQEYVYALSIDNCVTDLRLIDDMKKFISEGFIVMPYFNNSENYHKDIIEEFDKYTKNLIIMSNINNNSGPKI